MQRRRGAHRDRAAFGNDEVSWRSDGQGQVQADQGFSSEQEDPNPTAKKMNEWRHFREWVERSRKRGYESLIPEPFPPMQVYLGGGRPRRLLYFTKDFLCHHWMLHGQFPKHWIALVRYGVPT